jgi:KUP system potassium uptake protein
VPSSRLPPTGSRLSTARFAAAALGVVFGDIGTSPLYTLKSCFDMSGANPSQGADVLGIASLLVWTLVVVVCLKYVTFIMRIDHDGEGGILALLARALPTVERGAPVAFGFVTQLSSLARACCSATEQSPPRSR